VKEFNTSTSKFKTARLYNSISYSVAYESAETSSFTFPSSMSTEKHAGRTACIMKVLLKMCVRAGYVIE
jgi:hypothetical protein